MSARSKLQASAPLLVALAAALAVGAPLLVGQGVDVPDDALYYELASWEWLHYAWSNNLSPWFVPGKLGGVSLFGDTVPMGPFYPAAWLLLVLPPALAFPVACLLHQVGALLAVRWLARVLGASETSATLAGAAVAIGPLGTLGFVDCRAVGWASLVWLPVALGAMERLRATPQGPAALRWTALAGAALAAILLGGHVRLSAAALALWGLWCLIGGLPLRWTLSAAVLGLAAGAPGFVPLLAEWSQAAGDGTAGKLAALAAPASSGLSLQSLPGWLVPRPWVPYADASLGVILGGALLLGLGRGPLAPAQPAGRLALLAAVLLLAALSPAIPGLRWLFAPLLVLSHPVNDVWSALALIPAAAAAACALDHLVAGETQSLGARLRGAGGLVLVGLVAGAVLLAVSAPFGDADDALLYRLGLLHAGAALLLAAWLLARPGRARLLLVCAVALVDLCLFSARMHQAVPSRDLGLQARTEAPELAALDGGFLDIDDLARLEAFDYESGPATGRDSLGPDEHWDEVADAMQVAILDRPWPVHLGMARGTRGLAGRAKLAPRRQIVVLEPLAEELRAAGHSPEDQARLFEPRGLGARTLQLHGIPVAAGADGQVLSVGPGAPPCWVASRVEAEPREAHRIDRLLAGSFDTRSPALAEDEAQRMDEPAEAVVDCSQPGRIQVEASGETVVVLRQRLHPGWRIRDASGAELASFPLNQVHLGVRLPEGSHELSYRFVPPGLQASLLAAGGGWLALGLLGVAGRRRREVPGGSA